MEVAVVVAGSGAAVVVAATGLTVAVVAGAGSDIGVLAAVVVGWGATVVAVWMNAPPGTEEASGLALVVGAGVAAAEVVAAGATLDESEDPEPPEAKESEAVRSPTVPDWQELGPDDQPIRRLATSEA